jgi:hypothetical protein
MPGMVEFLEFEIPGIIDVMFFFFREVLEKILGFPDIKPRNLSKTSWKKKTSHQFWLESFFSAFNLEFH